MTYFHSDWIAQQKLETAWPSAVTTSFFTDAEDRWGLTTKPRRTLEVTWKGMERNTAQRMLMRLLRSMNESIEVPLYMDQAILVSHTASVLTVLDASNRRFVVGQKVVAISPDGGTILEGSITSVGATTIGFTAGVVPVLPAGSLVMPVIDALPVLRHEGRWETDELINFRVIFREKPGSSAIPSIVPTFGDNPSGFPTINSLPVLNLQHNWRVSPNLLIGRTGTSIAHGKGFGVEISGQRPIQSFLIQLSPLTRAEAYSMLEFFDSRRGRCLPFWMVSPHSAFRPTQDVGPNVFIEALDSVSDITEFVDYIAVEEVDGTIHIEELSSVAVISGTEWRLDPSSAFSSIPLSDIARVSTGHLVRFSVDALEEEWVTDEAAGFLFRVTELVNEETIEVTGL